MHVTGACHCGSITFSAEVDEAKVMVCHCTDCQVLGASAFRYGAIVLREAFVIQGAVHQRAELKPSLQLWRQSALPWIDELPGVPGCVQQEAIAGMIPRPPAN